MSVIRGRFLEPLATSLALKRRLTRVSAPPVIVQGHLLIERPGTKLTGKLLDRVVRFPVPRQIRLHRKSAATLAANILLLRPVHPGHVRVQMASRLLLFATDRTLQFRCPGRSLLTVLRVLVVLQLAGRVEPFRTNRTLLEWVVFAFVTSINVQLKV